MTRVFLRCDNGMQVVEQDIIVDGVKAFFKIRLSAMYHIVNRKESEKCRMIF